MTPRKSWDQIFAEDAVIQIGGTTYDIGALTVKDLSEFCANERKQRLCTFYETSGVLPPAVQAQTIATLLSGAFADQDIIAAALTIDGALWILQRALENAKVSDAAKLAAQATHGERQDKAVQILQMSGVLAFATEAGGDDSGNPPQTGDESSPG